jgi:hypothetical protein
MTITSNKKFAIEPVLGETDEDADVNLLLGVAEATALTVPTEQTEFVYSATAEDNGTAGILDGQPGLVYAGPNGGYARVKVQGHDVVEHAIISVPEAGDTVALAIYKNSDVADYGDEGFVTQNEIAIEMNVDTVVGPLQTNDVIRVALVGGGLKEIASWDVAPGTITLT